MEETLQHQEATQCIGLSATGSRNHHPNGNQPDHALTITLDQSDRAAQPGEAARQLPDLSTTIWVDPSSTGETRHRGALNYPG